MKQNLDVNDLGELTIEILRTLFKGLLLWRSAVESDGEWASTIVWQGGEWNIMDVDHLYAVSQSHLASRQAQAIHYFLVHNMKERDVAVRMGIKESNPIGMYASDGLAALVQMVRDRSLPN